MRITVFGVRSSGAVSAVDVETPDAAFSLAACSPKCVRGRALARGCRFFGDQRENGRVLADAVAHARRPARAHSRPTGIRRRAPARSAARQRAGIHRSPHLGGFLQRDRPHRVPRGSRRAPGRQQARLRHRPRGPARAQGAQALHLADVCGGPARSLRVPGGRRGDHGRRCHCALGSQADPSRRRLGVRAVCHRARRRTPSSPRWTARYASPSSPSSPSWLTVGTRNLSPLP